MSAHTSSAHILSSLTSHSTSLNVTTNPAATTLYLTPIILPLNHNNPSSSLTLFHAAPHLVTTMSTITNPKGTHTSHLRVNDKLKSSLQVSSSTTQSSYTRPFILSWHLSQSYHMYHKSCTLPRETLALPSPKPTYSSSDPSPATHRLTPTIQIFGHHLTCHPSNL